MVLSLIQNLKLFFIITFFYFDVAFSNCSSDQAKILTDAIVSQKSESWITPENQKTLQGIIHKLLFGTHENIPQEKRTQEDITQTNDLFALINEIPSIVKGDNFSEYITELKVLSEILDPIKSRAKQITLTSEIIKEQKQATHFFEITIKDRQQLAPRWLAFNGSIPRRRVNGEQYIKTEALHKKLDKFFERKEGEKGPDQEVIEFCKELREAMSEDASMWTSWMTDLQKALQKEYVKVQNRESLRQLNSTGKIDPRILIDVLIARAKEAEFSGETVKIDGLLSEEDFGELLKNGTLIIDNAFKDKRHGIYTHMFQYDMMIHFAKSKGKDKKIVRKFLAWMGRNEEIRPEGFTTLDIWQHMFDSLANVTWSPESQNHIFQQVFGLEAQKAAPKTPKPAGKIKQIFERIKRLVK